MGVERRVGTLPASIWRTTSAKSYRLGVAAGEERGFALVELGDRRR